MTDVRLQREHEHSLSAAVRTWFGVEAGKVNQAYAAKRQERLRAHHLAFDALRARRQELLSARPRDEAALAAVEQQMRDHRKAPPPSVDDLAAQRLAEVNALDAIVAPALRDIRNRAVRGELDVRMVWDERSQSFRIPAGQQEPANA